VSGVTVRGTVARVVRDKAFGFIRSEDGIDYFFHKTGMATEPGVVFEDLQEGDRVQFTEHDDVKGPRAEDVELVVA
jgi:cold shock CspA family protein